jgi:hypothetical protein
MNGIHADKVLYYASLKYQYTKNTKLTMIQHIQTIPEKENVRTQKGNKRCITKVFYAHCKLNAKAL